MKLVINGRPIVSEYTLSLTEKAFKENAELMFVSEDDMDPFSISSKRFVGHFHGNYRREFSVKAKGSFFRKNSISNSIWIHGKVEPKDEQSLSLKVTYYRTKFAKYGQWVLAGSIGVLFLIITIRALWNFELINFLIFSGTLIFFYLFGTLISVSQANGQIDYFEKNFIDKIEKH